jgi:hypothetical protein
LSNETVSTQVSKEVVFIDTWKTQRGGLGVGMNLLSKEGFLKSMDEWNERKATGKIYSWSYPTIRYAYIDGATSKSSKDMYIGDFERIFSEDEIKRLGRVMEYKKGEYPVFRKEIYVKHGILLEG